ncbi:hypothetical protein Droror1_Dr00006540, partial [Drosera rotundifolia]
MFPFDRPMAKTPPVANPLPSSVRPRPILFSSLAQPHPLPSQLAQQPISSSPSLAALPFSSQLSPL